MYISQHWHQSWYENLLGDQDQDAMTRALIETNPHLLAVTSIVSIVYTVFEILAFKNDIQLWQEEITLSSR